MASWHPFAIIRRPKRFKLYRLNSEKVHELLNEFVYDHTVALLKSMIVYCDGRYDPCAVILDLLPELEPDYLALAAQGLLEASSGTEEARHRQP